MFFLLRCAFWLTLVAVALPWVASSNDAERVAARGRPQVRPAVAMPARSWPPVSATCAVDQDSCIEGVAQLDDKAAKLDLIAMALDDETASMAPHRSGRSVVVAAPRRVTPAKRLADPIAAELLRLARRTDADRLRAMLSASGSGT